MKDKDLDIRQWWTHGIGDPYDQITDMLITAQNVERVHAQNVEYAAKCQREARAAETQAKAKAKQLDILATPSNVKAAKDAEEDRQFAQSIAQTAQTTLETSERSLNLHLDHIIRAASKQAAKKSITLAYTARTAYQWAMDALTALNADKAEKLAEAYPLPDSTITDEVRVRERVIVSAVVEVVQGDEPTISDEDAEALNAELQASLIGLCPYDVESARRMEAIIMGIHGKYPDIAETLCHTTYQIGAMAQPHAAPVNSFANVPCRVADVICRRRMSSEQQALLFELLADLKVPKGEAIDADAIPDDAPMSVVPLDRSKLAGVAKAIYGKNIDESRAKVLADLDRMSRITSFDYVGKDGRVKTRERLIFPQVIKDKETGAMESIAVHLDAVFRYLTAKHFHHLNMERYRQLRREANGDEAGKLILAILAKWDSIIAQTAKGYAKEVSIMFADIFDDDLGRRNSQNKAQRAIAAAASVAEFMRASSWAVITAKGIGGTANIGISFTFQPRPLSVEDTETRIRRLEKKTSELQASMPKKHRGRPPKNTRK